MKLSDRIVPTQLLTTLANRQETDEARVVEHAQACYEAMRKDVAIKDAGLRELIVGEEERPVTLLDACRIFTKVTCVEQCEQGRFMAAYVDVRKELDALRLGAARLAGRNVEGRGGGDKTNT